ncbi:hypothetical protein A2W24_03180 [Microgenomates group bacterium RBG_16_45_19]|nr:MAG: hypothetical protein A2W24_03180 [Microgenomates group bacterium RBG_16_45_19]
MTKPWPLSPADTAFIQHLVTVYLSHRPLFYSFIRPQEGWLFHRHRGLIQAPILDFGCGDGFFAYQVFGTRAIDVGLDIVRSRISASPQSPAYQKIVTYSGQKIPFPDKYFSTVISNCVFEHLPHLESNLTEIYRVLKPGGHLLTTVATNSWEEFFLGSRFLGQPYLRWWRRRQAHINLLSLKQWQTLLRQTGFSPVITRGYLSDRLVRYLEMTHYLSWPSLLAYKLSGRWVWWSGFYSWLNLSQALAATLIRSLTVPPSHSGAVFLALTKPLYSKATG